MTSPPVQKSLNTLHPMFRVAFEAWLAEAAGILTHVEFRVTEARRTLARQTWLYAQGRYEPFLGSPRVTWTLESLHRWGLAADIAMIRKETGRAIWEIPSWVWLYKVAPVEPYGLRTIVPREYVHIEYRYAKEAIKEAGALGLVQS